MFIFDVETLGKESNSVILSMAAIYFDPDKGPSYKEMYDDAELDDDYVDERVVYLG
jgi:hypothetical protein